MKKKTSRLSWAEARKICDEAGLTNDDWDEGGGYYPKSVARVLQGAYRKGITQLPFHQMSKLPKEEAQEKGLECRNTHSDICPVIDFKNCSADCSADCCAECIYYQTCRRVCRKLEKK